MSAKAAKGVKRQLRRLDDFFHHVTHTKHDHGEADEGEEEEEEEEEHDIRRRRTVSVPSPVLPSTVPSFRVIRSRSAWYLKQTSNDTEDRSSHPRFTSVEVGIQTDGEMADQGMLSEEARAEGEKLSSSEAQLDEAHARYEQEKEDRSTPAALSPVDILLDVPSPPPLYLQEPIPTLDVNKGMPPSGCEEEEDEEEEDEEDLEDRDKDEELPDLYLPSLILPAMFLPIPNVRSIFRFYSLTWWLRRHS